MTMKISNEILKRLKIYKHKIPNLTNTTPKLKSRTQLLKLDAFELPYPWSEIGSTEEA